MNKNFIDADAFIAAMTGAIEKPVVRMYGRDWTLSAELPTLIYLRLIRALSPDEELTVDEEQQMIEALLGKEQYEEILPLLTASGVTAFLLLAMSHYSGNDANKSLATIADEINASRENAEDAEKAEGETEAKPRKRTKRQDDSGPKDS